MIRALRKWLWTSLRKSTTQNLPMCVLFPKLGIVVQRADDEDATGNKVSFNCTKQVAGFLDVLNHLDAADHVEQLGHFIHFVEGRLLLPIPNHEGGRVPEGPVGRTLWQMGLCLFPKLKSSRSSG